MRSATTNPDLGLIATPSRLVLIAARPTMRIARARRSGGYLGEELPGKTVRSVHWSLFRVC